jgi:ATP-dependent DNA helicase RecQ
MNLRDALHEFRRNATVKKFSRAILKNSGPGVVMSNEILQRIVDCAHFHKIESREQLERETRWAGAGEFGDEIVDLIGKHRPKSPPTADEGDASSSSRLVKSRKCSKCGALDHICKPYHHSIR